MKAAEYLYEQDGKFAIYYKAPRFEEITEALYISKTEKQLDHVDESAIKQYCALLSLFSEQESYDADEVRDAEAMMSNPDGEEPEDVARYDALLQQVSEHRAVMPKDISLDDIKAIALRAYRGGEVRSAYVDKSDANSLISEEKTELPPDSVDKPEENAPESEETVEAVDVDESVNHSPACDSRLSESDEIRDWADLELDIARALWEGELHWEFIPSAVEQWAQKMVKRRDGEMMRWYLALQQVPDILSRSREFIFRVIRSPHDPEIYLTPEAIDAYVASFVEPESVDAVPWSEEAADEIAEAAGPDADDEWVPGLPEDEPETPVASEAEDAPAIAEPETVAAEATESEIHYSPETDMPAFLRDLKPVNGAVEDGRLFATVDALNERLADIPAGGSLVLWGLDNGIYHAVDGYSSTQIRLAHRGGIAALDWYQNAPRKSEESPALTLGTALHTAILEPERFETEYACAPSVNLRTNEGKKTLAAFEADCAGRGMTSLKREDFDTVCLMRDSALAYPTVASLLENGVAELSLFWRMENGLLLKVRPDWLGEFAGAPFLLDIKTTDDVLDFGKSVEKFGYHLQAAFYELVTEKVFGLGVDFAFCAISKRQECGRYPVLLGVLDEEDGYTGRQSIETTLFHLATGNSHSASGLATVSRPWWAKQADRKRREAQGVMA
ncbi:PD-(D/E)XK nuclease-like domain-containing protein [Sodalis sp.]|uniref:PD-(D/E)XK nuclease-like domain-containing protein n=1 Tax=Sodalis sp. (in: enterobacteria) TaxID=1898979 RepID=UPI003872E836